MISTEKENKNIADDIGSSIELYKKLFLIRASEEAIIKYYFEDEMKTPMHMSMGGEAVTAGVCHALSKEDLVFGTYRSHALYLSKANETDLFFAELYGKDDGVARGKSGSMHLFSIENGYYMSSAIVAGHLPVSVGAAYANKVKGNSNKVAVFFGDGAIDEGAFWESLNLACLYRVPILFVCEDNGYAVHTEREKRHGYKSISNIVRQFNCNVFEVNSTDVEDNYEMAKTALSAIDETGMPSFLHTQYYRYLEHVGINEDYDDGYRTRDEYDEWLKKDPIKVQRDKLISKGITEEKIASMEEDINKKVELSIQKAKSGEFSNISVLLEEVFCERN